MFQRSRRHARQPGFALILLASQLMQVGFDKIPPVTLVSILGQVAIFLRLIPLKKGWPAIREVCISSNLILRQHDFKRLIMAPLFHLNDWHLYYNMVSFLWKGMHLERKMGSPYFAYLLAVFSVLTSAVTVGLGHLASECSGDYSYYNQCAAGFSGVIFALKLLTTYDSPQTQMVMGLIPVPGPLICWAELFLIQLITPNVSFIGHLAGIIVGLLYVKGPLKYVMQSVGPTTSSYTYTRSSSTHSGNRQAPPPPPARRVTRNFPWPFNSGDEGRYPHERQQSYTYRSGPTGFASTPTPSSNQNHNNYAYTGGLTEDEQIRRAMEESQKTNHYQGRPEASAPVFPPPSAPPSYEDATANNNHLYPDLPTDPQADMRQRRLARFT